MSREAPIEVNNRRYIVNTQQDAPADSQPWALVKVDLQDEITSAPLGSPARITSNLTLSAGAARIDGGAGLIGVPANALSSLSSTPYPRTICVDADGYVPDCRDLNFIAGSFHQIDLGSWPLHRRPLSIYGRVNLLTGGDPVPVAGAAVSLTRLWRQVPSAVLSPPPDPFTLTSLRPVLSAMRPAGASIARRVLTPVPSTFVPLGDMKRGDTELRLSNTDGLAPGEILAFDRTDAETREFVALTFVGSSGPGEPGTVRLRFPLAWRHTTVEHVASGAAGPANPLGVPAIAGDTVLLANSVTGISSNDIVEVTGGTAATEYRVVFLFSAVTDSRGLYRLPALSRAGQVELAATDGAHLPVAQMVIPDYTQGQNRIDFTLR